MSIKPHPKRAGLYIIRLYENGRKKDPVTGKPCNVKSYEIVPGPYDAAFAYHEERKRELKATPSPGSSPTMSEVLPDFLAHYKTETTAGTLADFSVSWKRLSVLFGKLRFNQITPALITQYKNMRLEDGVKPRTISKELTYLSGFCTWAALPENNYADPLPFRIKGFSAKQNQPPPTYLLSDAEIESLIAHIKPAKRCILLLYTDMGLRRCEALNITGLDVDLDRRIVRIRGKGDKEEWLPIATDRLYGALEQKRKECGTDYFFRSPVNKDAPLKDIKMAIKSAAIRAGIEKRIYNHLLRHNFATRLLENGVDVKVVQILMRHSKIETTMKYIHASNRFVMAELQKFTEKVGGSLSQNKLRIVK